MAKDEDIEDCRNCGGSGYIFVRRNSRGEVDYIDGSPTNETMQCERCQGEGLEPT